MENIVPDKYYDIADEYALESEESVKEQEYDGLAHYFQLLITCLTNNEEISEEAQKKMAAEAGIDKQRIDDIAEFLNRWGND
ncbi:YmjA family protein [Morganella morganii]|uniref:YmjA family protein n=1 Tax=Morganella morganii TaxID=582 RepID=UPI00301E1E6E